MSEEKKVRTVSQLDELSSLAKDQDNLLFEVSEHQTSTKWSSRKCSYTTLRNQISAETDAQMAVKYSMTDSDGNDANIKGMDGRLRTLEGANMTVYGVKHFDSTPTTPEVVLDNVEWITDSHIPNIGMVKQMTSRYGSYMTPYSYTSKMPIRYSSNNTVNGSVYEEYETGTPFYYWHIDDGQMDSSLFTDDELGMSERGAIEMKDTGLLTIYGWLADNGSVRAQEAWVGLFVEVRNDDESGKKRFMPFQIQPWIQGSKHNVMQYVGFNVAVQAGMKLKIVTGFAVNGKNSGLNDGNCLTFKDSENMPNTFMGYIIQNGD